MQPSRIDSLRTPRGGVRVAFVVAALVVVLVAAMLVMGLWGWGWLTATLLPVAALTLYLAVSVVRAMMQKRGEEREEG